MLTIKQHVHVIKTKVAF